MASRITLKLSFGDDLRRLAIDPSTFSYPQLKDTIKRLYVNLTQPEVDGIVLKYLDDEGDHVTISSNEELTEALNLALNEQPPVLRLYLNDDSVNNEDSSSESGSDSDSDSESGSDDEGCESKCENSSDGVRYFRVGPFVVQAGEQPNHQGRCPQGRRPPWCSRRSEGPQSHGCPFQQQAQPQLDVSGLPRTRTDARHPHQLQLTLKPYGHGRFVCDGCSLTGEGVSYQCAECSFDLHVDCAKARESSNPWQRRQQWFRLHQAALQAMELHTREGLLRARDILREQANVSVYHRVTPLYNLACVEALLGEDRERAVDYLREAVAAGWTDVDHIKEDADLESLRNLDSYKAVVAALSEKEEADEKPDVSAEEPKQTPSPKVEKKEEAKNSPVVEKKEEPTQPQPKSSPVVEKKAEPTPTLPRKSPEVEKKAEVKAEEKIPLSPQIPSSPSPAPALTNSIDEFAKKLKTLEEMGFSDRRRNIAALVGARGDLVQALQNIFDHQ